MKTLELENCKAIGGGMSESTCVAIVSGIGGVAGAVITRTIPGTTAGATIGNIVGGVICNPIVNHK